MNDRLKHILRAVRIYYPLQLLYRDVLFRLKRNSLRRKYHHLRGPGFICNYCGSSYKHFAPWYPEEKDKAALELNHVVAGYGKNIICPWCLSTARERLLKAAIPKYHSVMKKKILHISPEKPLYDYLSSQSEVITVDYFPQYYRKIDPQIQFADATQLPFEDAAFDMVIANHIMEHIPDDSKAMQEIFRVLKPGGTAVMQVPFSVSFPTTIEELTPGSPAERSRRFGQHDHVRIYALNDYIARLQQVGFTVRWVPYEAMQEFYVFAIQPSEGFLLIEKQSA